MKMRPTLVVGDVWDDALANAAGYPILDGADEYGHGPKVPDAWLSDDEEMIKNQFYSWQKRIKVTPTTGLGVSYTSTIVIRSNGQAGLVSAGTLSLPDDSTGYIFIDDTPQVVTGSFPELGFILAYFVTSGGEITTLSDLRYQSVDYIQPLAIPQTQVLQIGDVKLSAKPTPDSGWLICNGASYTIAQYPALFSAIGTTYNNPNDSAGTFRVPDLRQRCAIGTGTDGTVTDRELGTKVGAETTTLTSQQMPTHNHGVSQTPHSHSVNDPGHTHTISDSGHSHVVGQTPHSHGINDPGHLHEVGSRDSLTTYGVANNTEFVADFYYNGVGVGPKVRSGPNFTGINIAGSNANISISNASSNISISPKISGITVNSANATVSTQNSGGGLPHTNMQPSTVLNYLIRAV
jgi:microcystin-dependent protein